MSFVTGFVLKSILSDITIATPSFLFPFTWNLFFHSLNLSVCLSFSNKSLVDSLLKASYLVQLATLCLLIRTSNSLTCNVIIDKYALIAVLLFVFWLFFLVIFCSFLHLFCSPIVIWWFSFLTCLRSFLFSFCVSTSVFDCGYQGVHIYCCAHAQPCLTLCDPMDPVLPGSSVHGIFSARILE